MLSFPNCKINIGLYVTRKREDGYHDLETVFYPVSAQPGNTPAIRNGLRDVLELAPAENGIAEIHMSGLAVAGDKTNNLVWKAYQLLLAAYPQKVQPLHMFLHKVIPMGAGLGGGSADGAFMLRLMNEYFNLGLDKNTLANLALKLGSDCPFFIYNTPMFGKGRGEQLNGIPLHLSAYSMQIICPQVHVATATAFGMLSPRPASFDLRKLHELPVEAWKDHIANDFEQPVFHQHPELADIRKQLYAQGAIYASMSGSGSALYGIFPKGQRAAIETGITADSFYID